MLEVEIKIKVDAELISRRLSEEGAELLGTEEQEDLYFQHPDRDFIETDEALRIRISEGRAFLTYKGPKKGNRGKVREELDCPVGDADRMISILMALGFQEAGRVHKVRELWRWEGAVAAVDRVSDLGGFIEMEVPSTEESGEEALSRGRALVWALGLDPDEEIRKSYLELLLESGGDTLR